MFNTLDPKVSNELSLLRRGWFSPEYELTDGTDGYGKLSYNWPLWRKARAITAKATWTFKREALFSRTILITDENGALLGKSTRDWFSRKRLLTLQTGFQAEFYRPSIWSWEYVWESAGYGTIMHIKSHWFRLRYSVYIDQSMTPPAVVPLLIFFGTHLTILGQRRRAAHY